MVWVQLVVALLKVIDRVVSWAHDQGLITQGYDEALSDVSQSILAKTAAGKAIFAKVNAMSNEQVNDALEDLEPKA